MAAAIALVVALPNLSAAASPSLPPLTAQQLIEHVQQANVNVLSGTIQLSPNLGIPNLGALSDAVGGGRHDNSGFKLTDLLSGAHQARVWFDGPGRVRVALIQSMAETDVVHNGNDIWIWDSTTLKVTHYSLPARTARTGEATAEPADPIKTPDQLAKSLLDGLDPSTAVSVSDPHYVAGQKAYQLVLTPRTAASTVDHVTISVDATRWLPLQVQLFAKGQKASALDLGFTSISFAKPAASNFNFTPPPEATVTTKALGNANHAKAAPDATKPATDAGGHAAPVVVGKGWESVNILPAVQLPKQASQFLAAATPVTGAFGHGRLLESALVNILILDDGRVAVGAVNVGALEAAVASAH